MHDIFFQLDKKEWIVNLQSDRGEIRWSNDRLIATNIAALQLPSLFVESSSSGMLMHKSDLRPAHVNFQVMVLANFTFFKYIYFKW